MNHPSSSDEQFMSRCLELARKGSGHVSPNPMVGCVIVDKAGTVIGEGWHERYGEPHAERNAIADAHQRGHDARLPSSTMYVNLEPCNHHGRTPPCTDAILEAGIPRVVVGTIDLNPEVDGSGLARLRSQGVHVRAGILERESFRLNEAFFTHKRTSRPLITLKVAQTLDGRVATISGDSKWISGPASRRLVHRWRSEMDAVLVGHGTALVDDPALTVRHVEGRQPRRIVLDRQGSLPASLRLFSDDHASRTIAVIGEEAPDPEYGKRLHDSGGSLLRVPVTRGHLDLVNLFQRLGSGREGVPIIQSIMVEAGPRLGTALLRMDLIDRLALFIAPKLIGRGTPSIADLGISVVADAITFADTEWRMVEEDQLFLGYLRPVDGGDRR